MTYLPRVEVRMKRECVAESATVRRQLLSASDVDELFRESLVHSDREKFAVLHLNAKHRVLSFEVVAIGSLTAAIVHPREVFKAALLLNAASIILVHNHPSGDSAPSAEDIEITRRMAEAGELLGVKVTDHVIIAECGYTSFAEKGLL